MKRLLVTLLLVMTMVGIGRADVDLVTATYDKFKDQTEYDTAWFPINSGYHSLKMTAFYLCPGKKDCRPSEIALGIWSSSESWEYLEDHELTFLVDGIRMPAKTNHEGDVHDGGVSEFIFAYLKPSEFKKISKGKSVEAKLFTDEINLTEQIRAPLIALEDSIPEPVKRGSSK